MVQFVDALRHVLGQDEIHKRLLLVVELSRRCGFCGGRPVRARYRWRGELDIREHIEQITILCVNQLLHFAQCFAPEALVR